MLQRLEPRTLFSADLPGLTGVDPLDESLLDIPLSELPPALPEDTGKSIELVFINSDVEDLDVLIRDIESRAGSGPLLRVSIIDADKDGISQVSEALRTVDGLNAIHIISHGTDRSLQLGNSWVDAAVLDQQAATVSEWQHSLDEGADLLVYGCDLASSDDGVRLLERLGQLTGTDVAASRDTTGHHSAGGNWQLEYQQGLIETEIALSVLAQADWAHELAGDPPIFNSLGGDIPAFHMYGPAVALDTDVTIVVDDEAATARYAGATITVQRAGGASMEDQFSIADGFQPLLEGGALLHNSAGNIGTVTEYGDGKLVIAFNASASTALVNETLQSLFYQTDSIGFGEELRIIDWSFDIESSDGSGDVLSVVGQSGIAVDPVSAIAVDDDLGELLSSTSVDVTHSELLSNDTNLSGNTLTVVNNTEPVLGSLTKDNSGKLTYSSTVGATGIDHFDYTITDGNPDILSHWRMLDGASDEVGRNDGVVIGNPTVDREGLDFDGDDSIIVGDLNYPSRFTISFDYKLGAFGTNGEVEYFYHQGDWLQPNSISIYAVDHFYTPFVSTTAHIATYIKDAYDGDVLDFGVRIPVDNDGNWHNYTLTREAGVGVSIYIDGILQASSDRGDGPFDPAGDIYIGSNQFDEGLDDHRMRDLRLYADVLSNSQIKDNESNQYSTATVSVELRNEEQIVNNSGVLVTENASVIITESELKTSDVDVTDLPENLTYTINPGGAPVNGELKVNTAVLVEGSSFTQKDINDGALSYSPDGGEHTDDSFAFTVDDGRGSTSQGTFAITIVLVNDAPILVENNGVNIVEGDTETTISAEMLAFSDVDDNPDELTYSIVSGPVAGDVVLATDPLMPITRFTQADINAGQVQFRHDGTEGASASFAFEMADGGEDGVPATAGVFDINVSGVNDAPLLMNLDNRPVYSKQDGPVILDADLSVSDAELESIFAGNFNGAELQLQRSGGSPNAGDTFSATGLLSPLVEGAAVAYDGVSIGEVRRNSAGVLELSFGSDANKTRVVDTMRSIAYSHPLSSPPTTVDIEWRFSDGNHSDLQGTGGALTAIGNSVVTILASPEFTVVAPDSLTIPEDTPVVFSGATAISIDDGILQDQQLQIELHTTGGGSLAFTSTAGVDVIGGSNNSAAITIEGFESAINAALQSLVYTPYTNDDTSDSLVIRIVPEAHLVGKYEFEGSADDTSAGVAHHGTTVGTLPYVIDSERGSVASFTGGGEHIVVAGNYSESTSITLSAWVDIDTVTNGAEVISLGDNVVLRVNEGGAGGVTGIFHSVNGSGDSDWWLTNSGVDLAESGWRHIAYSVDDSAATQKLFIDGVLVAETAHANSITYTQSPDTVIGAHVNGSDFYQGQLDDVRVYSKALSDDEIRWLAAGQLKAVEKQTVVELTAVNDSPSIANLDGAAVFDEGGSSVILDTDVAVTDPELTPVDNFAGARLTLQRAGGVPDPDDVFGNSGVLGDLIEGASFDYDGTSIGLVEKNSAGTLTLLFDNYANTIAVDNTLRSITYQNISVAPPAQVTLEWLVSDGDSVTSVSQGVGGGKTASALSSVNINAVNSIPVIDTNAGLVVGAGGADQVISSSELLVTDIDNAASEIVFTLKSALSGGVLTNAGELLNVNDSFTQSDINSYRVKYTNNDIAGSDAFTFTASDGTDSVNGQFSISAISDVPSQLSAGVTINKDSGNDAYLYDSSHFNHIVGDSLQTWEFLFSGLEPNSGGGQSTVYSAASVSGHTNHLAIKPNGEVEWYMQGWPVEGLSSGLTYHGSALPIPDLFDGEMHSIAIVFDLRAGEQYYQMYIDGKLANEVASGWTNTTIKLTADFPFVFGQKLSSVDSNQPTDPESQLHFVSGEHFTGTFHDVRIWDSIRTAAEIENNRFARIDVESVIAPADLQVNWQMTTLNGDSAVVNATSKTGSNSQPVTLIEKHVQDAEFTSSRVTYHLALDENSPNGTVAGFVMPRDPIPDVTGYQYELLDDADGAFAIDQSSGKVTVADATKLDFESMSEHQLLIRISGMDISGSVYGEVVTMDVLPINEFPILQNTTGAMSYVENTAAIAIEPTITVFDEELSTSDNFNGATLTLSRVGSAHGDDLFVATGELGPLIPGAPLTVSNLEYGNVVSNQDGELRLSFSENSAGNNVNAILGLIGYLNSNDTPPAEVQLQWVFTDGNELAQGAGGLGTSTHITTVDVTASNDAPTISNIEITRPYIENSEPIVLNRAIHLSDPELDSQGFEGSTIAVQRAGTGANAVDLFGATGALLLQHGGPLVYNGTEVGVVTNNAAGLLQLDFNQFANGPVVDAILKSITYANSSDDPAGQVKLIWSFSDGNTGQQGIGGALATQFVQTIDITAEPDPPVLQTNALSVSEGGTVVPGVLTLNTVDPDTTASNLIYTINDIEYGYFAFASSPTIETDTFSQQDLIDGGVLFVHDGGERPPAYRVSVSDGLHTDSGDAVVSFTGVNDSPTATGIPARITVLEDVASDVPLLLMSLSDSDSGSGALSVTFTTVAGGVLAVQNTDQLTVAGNAGESVIVSGTLENLNNWLAGSQALTYTGTTDANGTALDKIAILLTDNGNSGQGAIEQLSVGEIVVDIQAVNDEPSGQDGSIVISEDTRYLFREADFGFTDPIDGHFFYGVLVEVIPSAGQLTVEGVAVDDGTFISAVDIQAGLLAYTPAENEYGHPYAAMQFRVIDSGGKQNNGIDTDATQNTLVITVESVPDNPAGQSVTLPLVEDTAHVFSRSDFGFTDLADNDLFVALSVASVPDLGELYLNSDLVVVDQIIAIEDINAGLLKYVPPLHAHGIAFDGFDFQVMDSGTENSTDVVPDRITFDIEPSGDAPSGADNAISILEDASHTFSSAEFGFSDKHDNDNFSAVRIVTLPVSGSLSVNDRVPFVGEIISRAVIDAGGLRFDTPVDSHGDAFASFLFRVIDDGTVAHAGVIEDPVARQMIVTVLPVNDAPAAVSKSISIIEDTVYTMMESDFGFSDAADGNNFQSVNLISLPADGSLSLAGREIIAAATVTVSDINAGLLRYTPELHANGLNHARFSFNVIDDGGISSGGADTSMAANEIRFDVVAVSDQPAGEDNRLQLIEDREYTITIADFGFTDVHDNDSFTGIRVSQVSGKGVFSFKGAAIENGWFIDRAAIDAGALVYIPAKNTFGADISRLQFTVQDDGNSDHGGYFVDSTKNELIIDIDPVNDQPLIAINSGATLDEGAVVVIDSASLEVRDVDNSSEQIVFNVSAQPQSGVLFRADEPNAELLQFTQTDINQGVIFYQHDDSEQRVDRFSFKAMDSSGLPGVYGEFQFSIEAVAEAPDGTNKVITILEDNSYTLRTEDLGFRDAEEGDSFTGLILTMPPEAGMLTVDGLVATPGQKIQVQQIESGSVVFYPALHSNGFDTDRFFFRVIDSGDTTNRGLNTDQVPNYISFDVLSSNDAPAGTDALIELWSDRIHTFTSADFGFSDPHDGNRFLSVVIGTTTNEGRLLFDGGFLSAGQTVLVADIDSGKLKYLPVAGLSEAVTDKFTFAVVDDGGVANDGTNRDPVDNVFGIIIHAVHQPPTASPARVVIDEDTTHIFTREDFGFSDSVDGHQLLAVEIVSVAGSGDLLLDGRSVSGVQAITLAHLNEGLLSYVALPNSNGLAAAQIEYRLQDEGGTDFGGNDTSDIATLVIDINPVNDVPVAGEFADHIVVPGSELSLQLPDKLFKDLEDGHDLQLVVSLSNGDPLPDWLEFDSINRIFTGTPLPDDVGTLSISVTAFDSGNASAVVQFDFTIEPPVQLTLAAANNAVVDSASDPFEDSETPEVARENIRQGPTGVTVAETMEVPPVLERTLPIRESVEIFSGLSPQVPAPDLFKYVDEVIKSSRKAASGEGDAIANAVAEGFGSEVTEQNLAELFAFSQTQFLGNTPELVRQLDEQRESATKLIALDRQLIGGSVAVTTGLSIGYIIWLVRGGLLLSSVLTSMPAWRWVDPLPVLGAVDDQAPANDGESLTSMVERPVPEHPVSVQSVSEQSANENHTNESTTGGWRKQ